MAITYINYNGVGSAGSSSVTVNKPTNTQEGDIMFCMISIETSYPNSVPSGWSSYNGQNTQLFWKIAGSSEPSSYTWGFSSSQLNRATIITYRGDFDKTSPIQTVSNTVYGSGDNIVRAASMNIPKANSPIIIAAFIYYASASVRFTPPTSPSTFTEDVDKGDSSSDFYHTFEHLLWTSSGNTGNMDVIASKSVFTTKHAFAIALNPISGPANVKTINGLAIASVKTVNGLGIANVKTINGLA